MKQYQQEECKTLRRIEEAKRRATLVLSRKRVEQERTSAKEQYYVQKRDYLCNAQRQTAIIREQTRASRAASKNALVDHRVTSAREIKDISVQQTTEQRDKELMELQHKTRNANLLRQNKENARRKIQDIQNFKINSGKCEYYSRVESEHEMYRKTSDLVAEMEKEEIALIQRLQNTQLKQESVFSELAGAMGTSTKFTGLRPVGSHVASRSSSAMGSIN
eukprot:GHVR01113604.1.p1 GENE.GHVR01113604.1~~GHVR01113604.1.p1  ORF type:complete len:220 (-),score=46.86 GHVR01113604.1:155-814(-)